MKKLNLLALIFTAFLLTVSFTNARAQDEMPPTDEPKQNSNTPNRPNLLAELDLTKDQIRQIRLINREQQPLVREAKQRMLEANRVLDQAIYDDVIDESVIQTRLKEAQTAQAEFTKIRASTEFAVRKILTPEQLVKFREIRLRFKERNNNRLIQPGNRPFNNQNQRLNNRQRRLRPNN